ncbi:MAG TPA: SpoIID/LytB domain-containing protein [Solirubrobacteraceae bacterium]|nr:SpoIID/LytB domain-containing protein [Solirubrobacteraceae bacterium]
MLALRVAAALASSAALLAPAAATASPTLLIRGAGDGHGVGMSQEGALGYAQHGYGYAAILAHYYSGTALGHVPANTTLRVLMGGHVKRISLETYVRGVVGAEMPGDWPAAALEAQAVASRTYALTDHAGGARFDVYSDTRSQVYLGARAQTAQTDAAVAATAGQIVTYAGKPAITYFFASSGGATEAVQNGFPGAAPEPWLVGVPDPYDQGPLHSWSLSMSFAVAARRLSGLYRGAFRGIEVLRRGYSPRIVAAKVLGSRGDGEVTGPELANRLGLYSSWAYFSVRAAGGTQPEPDLSHQTPPPPSPPAAPPSEPGQSPTPVSSEPAGGTGTGDSPGPAGGTSAE